MWWWIAGYIGIGVLTLLTMKYLPPRMAFTEGTLLWRKILGVMLMLLLWPLFWIAMMCAPVEMP